MKKNMNVALLIMATVLVLAGCASLNQKVDGLMTTKWDKSAKSTAVLYFDENFRIHKIDGKENVNLYGQAAPIVGTGTQKDPKAKLVIPAGEHKLVISYKRNEGGSINWSRFQYEVPYAFVAGRYYQLSASENQDVRNPKFEESTSVEELVKKYGGTPVSAAAAHTKAMLDLQKTEDNVATNVVITDISGGKKKNSPSAVITVKNW